MTLSTASIWFLAGSSEGRSGLFVWAKGNSPQWVFGTRPPAVAEVSPSGAKPGAGPTNFTVTLVLLMVTDTLWPLWIQGNDFAVKDGLPFRSSLSQVLDLQKRAQFNAGGPISNSSDGRVAAPPIELLPVESWIGWGPGFNCFGTEIRTR